MQNPPEVGKTYISGIDPNILIYVESAETIDADGDDPATFFVEGCAPSDKDDMSGIGYEFTEEEWTAHRFTPYKS
ncbi:MAG: hypothetical protein OEW08_08400 [Gammaproteobacteria bacterium]|nr:hypothetical protein [Gammaproteobacteria bacterium]